MNKTHLRILLLLLTATSLLATAPARAVVIGGEVFDIANVGAGLDAYDQGGEFIELTLPFMPPNGTQNSVGKDTFNDPNLYAFDEAQNVTFDEMLSYEYGADNVGGELNNSGAINKNSGTLAGDGTTLYASHYVFFDPLNTTRIRGRIDFDAEIVAVFTSKNSLDASDIFLNNNVNYLSPALRGLEFQDVPIDVVGNSLYIDFQASTPGDFIRVLTLESSGPVNSVPEAPALGLMMLSLAMLFVSRRRG